MQKKKEKTILFDFPSAVIIPATSWKAVVQKDRHHDEKTLPTSPSPAFISVCCHTAWNIPLVSLDSCSGNVPFPSLTKPAYSPLLGLGVGESALVPWQNCSPITKILVPTCSSCKYKAEHCIGLLWGKLTPTQTDQVHIAAQTAESVG